MGEGTRRSPFLWSTAKRAESLSPSILILLFLLLLLLLLVPAWRSRLTGQRTRVSPAEHPRQFHVDGHPDRLAAKVVRQCSPLLCVRQSTTSPYVDFKESKFNKSKFRFVKEELCFDLYRRKDRVILLNEEDGKIWNIVDRRVIFTMELIVHRCFSTGFWIFLCLKIFWE